MGELFAIGVAVLKNVFEYKRWSDERIFAALREINESEYNSEYRFIRQQLNHIVIVEELFQARLLDNPPPHESTNTPSVPEPQELERRISQSNAWFIEYVSEVDPDCLGQSVSFQFADGLAGCLSRQEILFHVINHGTYHRGAIGHALDRSNAVRPADTYSAYIHEVDPGRRSGSVG